MGADLQQDYFTLFGLAPGYVVDAGQLSERYRELQRSVHPDRYAGASAQEQRLAVQQASLINEAFSTLKSPLARARYLLSLKGHEIDDTDTQMDPGFLMEQMEMRERLDDARNADDGFERLESLRSDLDATMGILTAKVKQAFEEGTDAVLEEAKQVVRKMQFIERLQGEVANLEEELAEHL